MPQTVLHLFPIYSGFRRPELSLSLQQCRLSTEVDITIVVVVVAVAVVIVIAAAIGVVLVVVVEALSVMWSGQKLPFVSPKMQNDQLGISI